MKIAIASDHAGWSIKQQVATYAASLGHEIVDHGPDNAERVDYPDYAQTVSKAISSGEVDRGILICGSGIGMSIAANRFKGVRAVVAISALQAKMARQHNDANVLCIGARFSGMSVIEAMVSEFFNEAFEGGRHEGRVAKIESCNQK